VNHATPDDTPDEPANFGAFDDAKLARADIGLYCALLFSPSQQRQAATALYAFWQEIREIKDECSDPEVAQIKLAWWREELHEMFAGRARHPVAQALAPVISHYGLPQSEFSALFTGVARHIGEDSYPDYGTLQEHGARTRGIVQVLAARIAGHSDPELLARVARLGSTLELINMLQNLRADARRGRVYLPQTDLRTFDIDANDLRSEPLPEPARTLMVHFVDRLQVEMTQHEHDLVHYAPLLSCRVEIAVAQARLAMIRRDPTHVFGARRRMPPWRLLWVAWRTARRERHLPVS
jgi:phytoene synthase